MNEEKQQKFTAKVRRGLVWIHSVAGAELAKKKAEATGVRIEGFTASELADVESAFVREKPFDILHHEPFWPNAFQQPDVMAHE